MWVRCAETLSKAALPFSPELATETFKTLVNKIFCKVLQQLQKCCLSLWKCPLEIISVYQYSSAVCFKGICSYLEAGWQISRVLPCNATSGNNSLMRLFPLLAAPFDHRLLSFKYKFKYQSDEVSKWDQDSNIFYYSVGIVFLHQSFVFLTKNSMFFLQRSTSVTDPPRSSAAVR